MVVLDRTRIDPDAALPTPGYRFDVVTGEPAMAVARCRSDVRQDLLALVSSSMYWSNLVEREYPLALVTGWIDDDDELPILGATPLTMRDVSSAQAGIDAARWIREVRLRPPED